MHLKSTYMIIYTFASFGKDLKCFISTLTGQLAEWFGTPSSMCILELEIGLPWFKVEHQWYSFFPYNT